MKQRTLSRRVPWTDRQMFDLAADIEHYPEFLPHWSEARILHRAGNVLYVTQEIDLGIRRLGFESRAELERPRRLRIHSAAGPFRQLEIDWRFIPGPEAGCEVTLAVRLAMHSRLLEAVSGRLMELLTHDILRRFCERAVRLYDT